jgi:hypothetical protein
MLKKNHKNAAVVSKSGYILSHKENNPSQDLEKVRHFVVSRFSANLEEVPFISSLPGVVLPLALAHPL